jgi:glucose-6-phosphate isomerase
LGTGGSSLGGKTLVSISDNYFSTKLKPKIFFIENVDCLSISSLMENINLEKTAVVVTSKSGETIETISQLCFILDEFKNMKIPTKKNFIIITESKDSTLKKIKEVKEFSFLEHSSIIGGRFSIFSIVGLIPAKLSGFNIELFCSSGLNFFNEVASDTKLFDYYFNSSLNQYILSKNEKCTSVIMPYVDSLFNLSLWYRQLLAESSGKNGVGITPLNSIGTVDQHSQLQLYLDGPKDKTFSFISRKKIKSNKLDCSWIDNKLSFLNHRSLEDLLYSEMLATSETLIRKKLPVRRIELECVDEESIAELISFFIIEAILICKLLGVNPFDQPAVEESKILTKEFLNEI